MDMDQPTNSRLQAWLDRFHAFRGWIVTAITYLSFRMYATEVTWQEVKDGALASAEKHQKLKITRDENIVQVLQEAKESLKAAEARRMGVTDKCKTLLTLSTLFLTLTGVLLPKSRVDSWIVTSLFVLSALALLNVIMLLVVFFGVRPVMTVTLDADEANLEPNELKKVLINSHRQCHTDLENSTNYLVEVYRVARFFFLTAFTLLVLTVATNSLLSSGNSQAKAVAKELKADQEFLRSVRGDPGPKGLQGAPGLQGIQGVQGSQGLPGVAGPKGEKGDKGDTGQRGEPGPKGDPGPRGEPGSNGDPAPKVDPAPKAP